MIWHARRGGCQWFDRREIHRRRRDGKSYLTAFGMTVFKKGGWQDGSKEEDGDTEMGEFGFAGGMAGADGGGVIFAGVDLLHDFIGDMGEIGHLVAENACWVWGQPSRDRVRRSCARRQSRS